MGASGWSYFVPYDSDFGAALERLHQDVFARGEYYRRTKLRKPTSIAHLRELNREEGTHSILDITRIGPRPDTPGREDRFSMTPADQARWFQQLRERFGTASELHCDDLVALFQTTTPSRSQVEARALDLMSWRSRGVGTIVVVCDGDRPHELLFVGRSGD